MAFVEFQNVGKTYRMGEVEINADVTGDRNLNGDDTMKILRAIAKLIPMGQLNPYAR